MQAYDKYKDSGIEWLGEIPEHWEVKRLKYTCNVNANSLPETTPRDFEFKYVDIGNVSFVNGIERTEDYNFKNSPSRARRIAKENDTIISTVRTYLKAIDFINTEKSNFIYSTGFAVLEPRSINPKHLANSVRSDYFTEQVTIFSKGMSYPAINATDLSNLLLILPPLPEQQAIAAFLDDKCAKIDEAVRIKQQQIEKLKELRQTTIHNAVTKGINPNAEMKDSGIDWIGEIPKHWEVKKVKNIFRLIIDPAENDNQFELLSVYSDIGVKPRKELEERGNKASTTDGYLKVRKGDMIVNKLLAWMGAIGVSNYEGVTSPAYDVLRNTIPVSANYYHNLFRMKQCSSELKKHSRGIMEMRLRLYFDKFGQILVPYPRAGEQQEIVNFLDAQTAKIDKAIALKTEQIAKLNEYKQSLINDVVTGKIKVTN